jgi:hypothetical protein
MNDYSELTKRQAGSALEEFLAERAPALERFREALSADGRDPDAMLDGTPPGLVRCEKWAASNLSHQEAPGVTDPAVILPPSAG